MRELEKYNINQGYFWDADADGEEWVKASEAEAALAERDKRIAELERQIEILWEIGAGNITQEQLENARKCKLIWE